MTVSHRRYVRDELTVQSCDEAAAFYRRTAAAAVAATVTVTDIIYGRRLCHAR